MSSSLWPNELQHARLLCPSLSPRACSNSYPFSQWYHPTILSSVVPCLLLPSVFPSIRVFSNDSAFRIRWTKYWSFRFSIVLQMNIQGWFPLRFDLAVHGTLRRLLQHQVQKHQFFSTQLSLVQLSHPYMTTGRTIALTILTFVTKVMSLLFNMLSRFVRAFLPRSKHLLISWQQSLSTVILEPKKIKSVTVSIVFPSICHEVIGLDAMILVFWMFSFKLAFLLIFHLHQEAL